MPSASPYPPLGIPIQTFDHSSQQKQLHKIIPQNPVQTQPRFDQFGTNSQASNNSNEESSGSEHRRKYQIFNYKSFKIFDFRALLPPAPSLTSIGKPQFFQQQQLFPGQMHNFALPPTQIGDGLNLMMMNRFCGDSGNFHQQLSSQNIQRVGTDNFFVEHF